MRDISITNLSFEELCWILAAIKREEKKRVRGWERLRMKAETCDWDIDDSFAEQKETGIGQLVILRSRLERQVRAAKEQR